MCPNTELGRNDQLFKLVKTHTIPRVLVKWLKVIKFAKLTASLLG